MWIRISWALKQAGPNLFVHRLSPVAPHAGFDLTQSLGRPVQIKFNVGFKQFRKTDVAKLGVIWIAQVDEAECLMLAVVIAAIALVTFSDPKVKATDEVVQASFSLVTLAIGLTRLRHGKDDFGQPIQKVLEVQAFLTLEQLFKLNRPGF